MHYSHKHTRGSSIECLLQESICQKCGQFLVLDLYSNNSQQIQETNWAKASKSIYTTDSIQILLRPIYGDANNFKNMSWLWRCLPTTHQEFMNPSPINVAQSVFQAIILYKVEWQHHIVLTLAMQVVLDAFAIGCYMTPLLVLTCMHCWILSSELANIVWLFKPLWKCGYSHYQHQWDHPGPWPLIVMQFASQYFGYQHWLHKC